MCSNKARHPPYLVLLGPTHRLLTVACPAAMDPDDLSGELVDHFLWSTCQLQRANQGYKLLKARDKATKAELDYIHRVIAKVLHPDKGRFDDWVNKNFPDAVDQATMEQAREVLGDFWATWLLTKEKFCDLDDGLYKQAGAHSHTAMPWHVFVFMLAASNNT